MKLRTASSEPSEGTTVRMDPADGDPVKRPKVLLADDNPAITAALQDLLAPECEVVGIARHGLMLLDQAARLAPDVVLADISMPQLDGLCAIAELTRIRPGVKVVLITMHGEPGLVRAALDDGASGFILKHRAPDELLDAVRAAVAGHTYVSPVLAAKLAR